MTSTFHLTLLLILVISCSNAIKYHTFNAVLHGFIQPLQISTKIRSVGQPRITSDVHLSSAGFLYKPCFPTLGVSSFDNVNGVIEFGRKLQQLTKQHSSRETIPSNEIKAIEKLILQYHDQMIQDFHNILYSFSILKFTKADFSNEVNDCLQRVGATYFASNPGSVYHYVNWLSNMKFSLQLNQINDINKGLILTSTFKDWKSQKMLYHLGHLNVTWSSLSQEATNALQHKLVKELPHMNEKESNAAIMGLRYMQVTYDQLNIVGSTLLQTIEKYAYENNKYLYKNLVNLKIPFSVMSENLKQLFIKAFRLKFKSGDGYAPCHLCEIMGGSILPNDLKTFICNELPAMLKSLTSLSHLNRLQRLKIKWSDIPEDNQDLLINAIVNYLPQMTENDKYYTIQGLIDLQPDIGKLPLILQKEVQIQIELQFVRRLEMLVGSGSRDSFSVSDKKELGDNILKYRSKLPALFHTLSYSTNYLKFTKDDFSDEVNQCLLQAGVEYFRRDPSKVYYYTSWLSSMKFDNVQVELNAIDNAIKQFADQPEMKISSLLYSLGHLNVTWSSLSQEATNALQHTLVKDLPEMNEKDCAKMLMGLRFMLVTYDQLNIVGSTLLQTIEKYANEDNHLYASLVDLRIPFALMSENVKQLFIEAFKVTFKSGDIYALYKLSEIIGDSLLPNDLKTFICNELPAILKSPSAMAQLTRLHSLNIRWSDIPKSNQDFIINAIVNYLPQMTEKIYFTMAGLFTLGVNYNSLPPRLQQEMQKHLIEILRKTEDVNHIQINLRRLTDIGIQLNQMNEELRELLRHTIEKLPNSQL